MPYIQYSPHPALSDIIDCIWHSSPDGQPCRDSIIIPDNCSDILIGIGRTEKIKLMFIGTMTKPLYSPPGEHMMGIRFKPGYAHAFFNIPMNELTDTRVDLDYIWNDYTLLEEGIYSQAGISQKLFFIQNMLLTFRKRISPVDARFRLALQSIAENTEYNSIENLSMETGISRQHLRRIFQKHIGINPVEYLRISRIKKTIKHIKRQNNPDMSRIAQDFGYYDQSHMIMDFRKYTGLSPKEYFEAK